MAALYIPRPLHYSCAVLEDAWRDTGSSGVGDRERRGLEYEKVPHTTLGELFAVAGTADQGLCRLLDSGAAMDEVINLGWPPEQPITGTRRKMLAHTLVHGLRHWAQIATALRQNGFKTGMEHDLVFSAALG